MTDNFCVNDTLAITSIMQIMRQLFSSACALGYTINELSRIL